MESEQPTGLLGLLKTRFDEYTGIREAWFEAFRRYVSVISREIRNGNFRVLRNLSSVGDESFARWWLDFNHHFVQAESQSAVPALVASAYGVVLDVGAGSGNQLHRMDKSKLKHVYGMEPNKLLIPSLTAAIKDTEMEGMYTPMVCGVEDAELELARVGVAPGTVDCIVMIQVFCSVKDPKSVVKQLHHLLKPGGELIFWEHQRNEVSFFTRLVQTMWNLVWPMVIGGCNLNRPTRQIILGAADWQIVEMDSDDTPRNIMPRVWGRLAKKSTR